MGSGADEFPITRRDGLLINAGLGWGVAAAALAAGPERPFPAAAQLAMHLGNGALHLGQAARTRSYNPGSLTAATLFVPLGVSGLRLLLADRDRRPEALAGVASGAASAVALMLAMRRRVRRSGAT